MKKQVSVIEFSIEVVAVHKDSVCLKDQEGCYFNVHNGDKLEFKCKTEVDWPFWLDLLAKPVMTVSGAGKRRCPYCGGDVVTRTIEDEYYDCCPNCDRCLD